MALHMVAGAASAAAAILIGFINYRISKRILLKDPNKYAASTVVRQFLNVGLLVVCYFIGEKAGFPSWVLPVGAVMGITVSAVIFTGLLLKVNKEIAAGRLEREKDNANG